MDDVLPSEPRAVFKLSLLSKDRIIEATTTTTINTSEERLEIPILKELVEAILFSRRFLPTYLAVLAATILIWRSIKWCEGYKKAKKRNKLEVKGSTSSLVSSSSSSTLQGNETPPFENDGPGEATPLISEVNLLERRSTSPMRRIWDRLRSILLYRPKPIPALTAPKNAMPANEITLAILLFLAINVFYLFFRLPLSRPMIFAIADRAGLLFVANLPVLYLLAAKNSQPFQYITGWSYEGLNIFHRRLGEWMTIAAIVHATGMIIAFYDLVAPSGVTIWWYLSRRIIILGCIAFSMYLGIYFTSVGYFRLALYELFLVLHIFLQATALVMLFFHHHDARPYVLAAACIWVLDRGIARIACKTRTFIATLELAVDNETILLYVDVPVNTASWFGLKRGWSAGQHVFLTIPSMGTKHRFQAHPFTIASPSPRRQSFTGVWPLQLTIRAQDGFSRQLLEYAKLHQHARIYLDGPYGSNKILEAVQTCDRLCLVAGGSGIAVTYPLAWVREIDPRQSANIIHNRTMYRDGVRISPNLHKSMLLVDQSRFAHFWVRQDARHESWVTLLPGAGAPTHPDCSPAAPSTTASHARDLVTHRFVTRSCTGEHQRPDIRAELVAWVKGDLKQKVNMRHDVCVVVSGPDGLVRDVQNTVASLVEEGWRIGIHVEKFGW